MQFITVKQHNRDEDEVIIHFLQWNGNEEEIKKLQKLIELSWNADTPLGTDYSDFECDIEHIISETAVNEMITLNYGFESIMFQKHIGIFRAPKLANHSDIYNEENAEFNKGYSKMAKDELHKKYHVNEFADWFYVL